MSQVNKLGYVDAKLGAPTGGQQTTRILFNTIENPGNTTTLVFFKNFQGLSEGQTNLVQNKLDASESVVIKTLSFYQLTTADGLQNFANHTAAVVSVIVGNQTVVKNLPLQFNGGDTGQAFDRLHENAGAGLLGSGVPSLVASDLTRMPTEIRLLTDIVIPPQVSFEVRVDSNLVAYGTQGTAVVCALGGYGKIFSAGMSF